MRLLLASGSRYRARLLTEAGHEVEVAAPRVDERAADPLLEQLGPEGLALHLATAKAEEVIARVGHPAGTTVVAADQVGVLEVDGALRLLTKQPDHAGAVAQLLSMSGTTHLLVNGLVVVTPEGTWRRGIDVCRVTMAGYGADAAESYVDRFEPFDTAGSYRLEDDAGLVDAVEAEHPSGVLGLPLPLLERLLKDQ